MADRKFEAHLPMELPLSQLLNLKFGEPQIEDWI